MPVLPIHFLRPGLWPVAIAAAAPVAIALWARRRGRSVPWIGVILQVLALLALIAGLMGARLPAADLRQRAVAVFSDVSASRTGASGATTMVLPERLPRTDYVFADGVGQAGRPLDGGQTLVAGVLELLRSRADRLAAAVVVTDGRFTDADRFAPVAAALAETGLPMFIVAGAPLPAPDARVVDLTVRSAREGGVEVAATVTATEGMSVTLRITRAGQPDPLLVRPLTLLADDPVTIRIADTPSGDTPPLYRAEIVEADLLVGNNAMAALYPSADAKVLWVTSEPDGPLLRDEQLVRMIKPVAPSDAPDTVNDFLRYSAVAVVDAGGNALSAAQRKALAQYVRIGGGLLLVGVGPHQAPADIKDPLNAVAPLLPSLYDRRKLAVTVILDASGSMGEIPAAAPAEGGGQRKIDLARQATLAMARQQLVADDYLRVVTFSQFPSLRFEGRPTERGLAVMSRALSEVQPGGGTKVRPALAEALAAESPEGLDRLFIVLSDLQTEKFDPADWAGKFEAGKVTLATVATGRPADAAPLKVLTEQAGGSFVFKNDLAGLAEVFVDFLRAKRDDTLVRKAVGIEPVSSLFGLPAGDMPDLDAYLAVAKQPDAEILAVTAEQKPLIARRQVDLGRTVCLALPAEGRHNLSWRQSLPARRLVAAAVQWVRMPPGDPRFDARVRRKRDRATLMVTAGESDMPINALGLTGELNTRGGTPREIPLRQTAPGEYTGDLGRLGTEPCSVVVRDDADDRVVHSLAIAGRYAEEYSRLGVDRVALERLSALTGGRIVAPSQLPALIQRVHDKQYRELWPWLLGAALVLMLLEWLTIRLTRKPTGQGA